MKMIEPAPWGAMPVVFMLPCVIIMILVGLGSSAQLLMTGILGEYVGRIYEEVKRRPLYVVESEINLPSSTGRPQS